MTRSTHHRTNALAPRSVRFLAACGIGGSTGPLDGDANDDGAGDSDEAGGVDGSTGADVTVLEAADDNG